jgi:hypothetical protein
VCQKPGRERLVQGVSFSLKLAKQIDEFNQQHQDKPGIFSSYKGECIAALVYKREELACQDITIPTSSTKLSQQMKDHLGTTGSPATQQLQGKLAQFICLALARFTQCLPNSAKRHREDTSCLDSIVCNIPQCSVVCKARRGNPVLIAVFDVSIHSTASINTIFAHVY